MATSMADNSTLRSYLPPLCLLLPPGRRPASGINGPVRALAALVKGGAKAFEIAQDVSAPALAPLASEVAQFGAQTVEIARAPVDFAPRPDGDA
jgi:hypothetical protein